MTANVLLVDDDTNILAGYKRQLRKLFNIDTAAGPLEGLELIRGDKIYAVILSDMQMPDMNGIQFLQEARKLSPDSVRLMLTGNADQHTAIEAINEGAVFRFLNKPCSPQMMAATIEDAVRQYSLVTAEKELLEETLKGSVSVLTDILSMVNPVAFGKARRIQDYVRRLCEHITIEKPWELEIAAMLSQLGCVTVPEEILEKSESGSLLSPDENAMLQGQSEVAAELIHKIPRLDRAARLIELLGNNFEPSETNPFSRTLESRILQAAAMLEDHSTRGDGPGAALREIETDRGTFDQEFVEAFERVIASLPSALRNVKLADLRSGMILAAPLNTTHGQTLVGAGQTVTEAVLSRIRNFSKNTPIAEPIAIFETPKSKVAETA